MPHYTAAGRHRGDTGTTPRRYGDDTAAIRRGSLRLPMGQVSPAGHGTSLWGSPRDKSVLLCESRGVVKEKRDIIHLAAAGRRVFTLWRDKQRPAGGGSRGCCVTSVGTGCYNLTMSDGVGGGGVFMPWSVHSCKHLSVARRGGSFRCSESRKPRGPHGTSRRRGVTSVWASPKKNGNSR